MRNYSKRTLFSTGLTMHVVQEVFVQDSETDCELRNIWWTQNITVANKDFGTACGYLWLQKLDYKENGLPYLYTEPDIF